MKKIAIESWKVKEKGKERDENIVTILTALLSFKNPQDMPKGFQQALMFNRILKAFDNKKELILDDVDYDFLKKMIETDTPALWGTNQRIMDTLAKFNSL